MAAEKLKWVSWRVTSFEPQAAYAYQWTLQGLLMVKHLFPKDASSEKLRNMILHDWEGNDGHRGTTTVGRHNSHGSTQQGISKVVCETFTISSIFFLFQGLFALIVHSQWFTEYMSRLQTYIGKHNVLTSFLVNSVGVWNLSAIYYLRLRIFRIYSSYQLSRDDHSIG